MIEEQAQVVAVEGARLVLQAQTQSACGSCSASKGCGTSVLAKVVGRKFTQFEVENNIDAQIGDTVVVGIPEDALLMGSMMMYIMPVVGMLLAALLADSYFEAAMQRRDLAIAASAFIGLIFAALVSKWYFQRDTSRQRFSPVVLRKIIGHGKL